MDKNIIRYDKEEDILYILIADGEVKDTVEIGDDVLLKLDRRSKYLALRSGRQEKRSFLNYLHP